MIVRSSACYRGVLLMETGRARIVFYIGVNLYDFKSLVKATQFIDRWLDEKKN